MRTETRVIALQAAYALILLAFSIAALFVLYTDILRVATEAFSAALTSSSSASTPFSPDAIVRKLASLRSRDITLLSVLILITAAIFAVIISRIALVPTRTALMAQKRLIGDIAHELRTPLAIIKTNVEVRMLDGDLSPDARRIDEENLEEIDRISDTINNLLTLNTLMQIEPAHFTNVNLEKVALRVISRFSELARKKPVRIRTSVGRIRSAYGNATALEQIVANLFKNALQHTEQGEIVVGIGPGPEGFIEFSVKDTGSGIAHEDLPHVFQPFYRGNRARTRGSGGGLGLTIVKELVELLHGRISVRSTRSSGTRVTVVLPHRSPAAEAAARRNAASSSSGSARGTPANEVTADFTDTAA